MTAKSRFDVLTVVPAVLTVVDSSYAHSIWVVDVVADSDGFWGPHRGGLVEGRWSPEVGVVLLFPVIDIISVNNINNVTNPHSVGLIVLTVVDGWSVLLTVCEFFAAGHAGAALAPRRAILLDFDARPVHPAGCVDADKPCDCRHAAFPREMRPSSILLPQQATNTLCWLRGIAQQDQGLRPKAGRQHIPTSPTLETPPGSPLRSVLTGYPRGLPATALAIRAIGP
jgi:hypothetical protein